MDNEKQVQGAPLDIPEAPIPGPSARPARPARPADAARRANAATPARQQARAGSAGVRPTQAQGRRAPQGNRSGGAKSGVRRAGSQNGKRRPTQEANELPLWLEKVIDWFMELPGRLKQVPGKLLKLVKESWFYRIYFGTVAVALIAIAIGLHWLNGFAADYEAAQPVHVADEVAQMFVSGDYNRIYDLDTSAQALSGGDKAFYVQSLSDVAAGKAVEYMSAFSSNKDELCYNVTLDGSKFASFTLVPSGSTTAHGNTLWQLGTVTTHVALKNEVAPQDPNLAPYRIQVLPEYAVTVDGRALGAADVIRTGIAILPEGFLPSEVTSPTLTEYGFYSEAAEPVIAVTGPDGAALTPREDSDNIWVCGLREDEALKAQYSEAIIRMAQRIAKYTTQDVSRNAALEAVQSGSPAEEIIKKFSNRWAPSHKEESFENMEVSEFYALSDSCITCHVKFDYILTSRRQNDYTYPTEYTFCIVRKGDEGKLYNLVFH